MRPGRCCMIHEAQAPVLGRLLEDPRCSGHNGRLCAASLQCSRRDRGPPTDTSHYPFKTKQLCRSFLALFIHALSLFLSLSPLLPPSLHPSFSLCLSLFIPPTISLYTKYK